MKSASNIFTYSERRYVLLSGMIFLGQISDAYGYNDQDIIKLQVTGEIITVTCDIDVVKNVSLGILSRQDLSEPGSTSGPVLINLKMSQCAPQLTRAAVNFSGPSYREDPAYSDVLYANEKPDGASDIGLELFNMDGGATMSLANGVIYSFPIDAETHSGILPIGARLYTPHGMPSSGDFYSHVTLTFTYQ